MYRFSDYVNQWLYADDGYYASYKTIGKEGDFYTSVSSSKFFGGAIANHIVRQVESGELSKSATICEIGAHHGYLLADIIEFIYTLAPDLLSTFRFAIVERFASLREFQRSYFKESFGDAVDLLHFESLADLRAQEAFFVANEIFDAFACELFYKGKCARVEDHKVIFDLDDEWVSAKANKYHKDRGEIAVGYEEFATSMMRSAKKFEFVTFDYGEMQARPDFSLRVYKDHKVLPFFDDELDIKEAFKKSDLTYDVTFEHLKDAFEEAGAKMAEFKTQMVALIDMGILDLLEVVRVKAGEEIYSQELQKVKKLIMPSFLGERFKMIRFVKNKEQ